MPFPVTDEEDEAATFARNHVANPGAKIWTQHVLRPLSSKCQEAKFQIVEVTKWV